MKQIMNIFNVSFDSIGLYIAQITKLSRVAHAITTDKLVHRVIIAKSFGVHQAEAVNAGEKLEKTQATTGGRVVDVAVEVTGGVDIVDVSVAANIFRGGFVPTSIKP